MPRPLRIAAHAELASLTVLLTNLATVHLPDVSALAGPVHGCAYLLVVLLTVRAPGADGRTKLCALIPGVGGLLASRRYERASTRGHRASPPARLSG